MEEIRCEICGKPGSRINLVCGECIGKAMTKTNTKIGKKTLEAMEELDAALETISKVAIDPEKEN